MRDSQSSTLTIQGGPPGQGGKKDPPKKKYEPPLAPTRIGRKKRKQGDSSAHKLPTPTPNARCKLRLLKLERIKDHLLLEEVR